MCAQWVPPFDPQAGESDASVKTHAVHCALIKLGSLGSIVYFSGNKWDGNNHNAGQVDHTALYDCASRTSSRPGSPVGPGGLAPDNFVDVFCSGHALLPDGRLLVAGGTSLMGIDPNSPDIHAGHWGGLREAWVFDPAADPKWTPLPPMNFAPPANRPDPNVESGGGRWYPSFVTLGDGSIIGLCGHPRVAGTNVDEHPELLGEAEDDLRHNNNTPEIFRLGAGAWELKDPLGEGDDHEFAVYYPRAHVLPSGLLLIVQPLAELGPEQFNSIVYDPSAGSVVASFPGPQLIDGNYLNPGYAAQPTTSVLLPLLPENDYQARVLLAGANDALIATIAPGAEGSSQWAVTSPRALAQPRFDASATLLPTGEVLVSGGVNGFNDAGTPGYDNAHGMRVPEIFNPATNSWSALNAAPATITREYHSSALLLPDGRVWTAGSEIDSVFGANNAEYRVELFEPDYIAAAGRPAITDAPPSVGYGETFTIHYTAGPAHPTITRVAVTRCGGATHGFDYDQRYVALQFTAGGGGTLTVTAPPNGNIAVPGQYLLWILDDGGRPCVTAPFLRIAGIAMEAVLDRSTYSIDDVDANPAGFKHALYVVFDGFIPSEAPATPPSFAFSVGGIHATPSDDVAQPSLELPGSPQLAQRVTFTFDITFDGTTAFDGMTGEDLREVDVTITSQYHQCTARLDLILTPNPYMMDGPVSYLSTDLRVFRVHASDASTHIPDYAWSGATNFINDLIDHLNTDTAAASAWFEGLTGDEETSWISLLPQDDVGDVFDFAVARVHRDSPLTDPAQDAQNVRILWRVFRTMQPALTYDTATLYRRVPHGTDTLPLIGINGGGEAVALPFYAAPRVSNLESQTDPKNLRTMAATPGSLGFYGCWLDINQLTPRFPRFPGMQNDFTGTPQAQLSSIQELMTGFHQCLVAEVHYKHDAMSPELPQPGDTPGSSDKLSQRNLSFGSSANPGSEATRTVQHSFELHTASTRHSHKQSPGIDALVVWWGNVPRDSIATFYFPTQPASAFLAAQPPGSGQTFEAVYAHTLRCRVIGDCVYLPAIIDEHKTLPALLTIELPPGVRKGERYRVRAMQFRGGRVLGAFELRIDVKANEPIIREDRDKLALLRHLFRSRPAGDHWRPIFERWASMTAARLEAFGVDTSAIPPSPYGAPRKKKGCGCLGWLFS